MKKTILKIILNFFGVTTTLAGLAVSFLAYSYSADAKASLSWPSVEGLVLESYEDVQQSSSASSGGSSQPMILYIPVVKYSYLVGGTEYINDEINFASHNNAERSNALAVIDKYPVSASVEVYYDAQNPEKSILEPGVHGSTHIWFILGVAMLLTGLGELFIANKVIDNLQFY